MRRAETISETIPTTPVDWSSHAFVTPETARPTTNLWSRILAGFRHGDGRKSPAILTCEGGKI